MKRVLKQDEIDALFTATQGNQQASSGRKQRNIQKYDLRPSRSLTTDQVSRLSMLHESFARSLGNSLGAYLRVGFDVNLVSAEEITYGEFFARLPELTYVCCARMLPIDARTAIHADLSLAFPIIDLILGGQGTDPIEPRELTEIEENIFESVIALITRDLQAAWAPVLSVDIQFERRLVSPQVQSLMQASERVLCLTFEIRLAEARGTITVIFPAVVANTLLRKMVPSSTYSERMPSRENRRRIRERLLNSRFAVDLTLPPNPISIRELLQIEPGHIVRFPDLASSPVHLNVSGKPMFLAFPVAHGTVRGAHIEGRVSLLNPQTRGQNE